MEINNCSVVLYNGIAPIEAHAGNSGSIRKWIDETITKLGKIHVTGWHRLIVLQQKEQAAADESGVAG